MIKSKIYNGVTYTNVKATDCCEGCAFRSASSCKAPTNWDCRGSIWVKDILAKEKKEVPKQTFSDWFRLQFGERPVTSEKQEERLKHDFLVGEHAKRILDACKAYDLKHQAALYAWMAKT